MEQDIKELLYNLAVGIIKLVTENEELEKENEELREYKERRVKMDAQHLQRQIDTFGDIMSQLQEKQYRIYFESNGIKQKTNEVFSNNFEAGKRCFWLNENDISSAFGQYIYEEEQVDL